MHEKKKTLRIAFDELELALERTRVRRHMLRNAFALFKLSCQRMREEKLAQRSRRSVASQKSPCTLKSKSIGPTPR
jgi:hypothetical protein